MVGSIPGRVLSAIGNLGSLLYNAGQNIIQGLINGISSMIGAVASKISSVASTIRSYLPFSPAKVGPLRDDPPDVAGATIGAMLARGITASVGRVSNATAQLAGAATPALRPAAVSVALSGSSVGQQGGSAITHVAQLNLHIAGNLDPTNPVAWRTAVENLRTAIRTVERSYA
jgi:phage-related protein